MDKILDETIEVQEDTESVDIEEVPDNTPQDQCSIVSIYCRICYDDTTDEPIITPCHCKGTIGLVHKSCLERWLAESNSNSCDLCNKAFETERTIKYPFGKSIWMWIRKPPESFAFPLRDARVDLALCLMFAPGVVLLTYSCLYMAEYYYSQWPRTGLAGSIRTSAARWSSVTALAVGLTLLLCYFLWTCLVIRYHRRVWYFWWQRETVVRVRVT